MNAQLVLGLAILVGAPAKPGPKQAEPPSLIGEWTFETWLDDGNKFECAGRTVRFDVDGKYVAVQDGAYQGNGTYTLGKDKDPAEIDWAEEGLPNTIRGVYKFEDGGNTLVVCMMEPDQKGRPVVFAAPTGSNCLLLTLKRKK